MPAPTAGEDDASIYARLATVPRLSIAQNFQLAIAAGRKTNPVLGEMIALRRGPGKLAPNEYFYYRAWDPALTREQRLRFVGKIVQHRMHVACNEQGWHATASDKLMFHTIAIGAGLPHASLLATTAPGRLPPEGVALAGQPALAAFLREPGHYPLFAKPIDGIFSLGVISADRYDPATDQIALLDGTTATPDALAARLLEREAGYVLQRRLSPDPVLAARFGPRLWSMRVLVLLTPQGPHIHRAVAKIATGHNPADNFWRSGNMLGAVDFETGQIRRVVRGTGAEMEIDPPHPDTGAPLVGTPIPAWPAIQALIARAAPLFPGIRTQSWDIALTESGPLPLELNFGGDLNLSQLAYGAGVLDETYRAHLLRCGYKF